MTVAEWSLDFFSIVRRIAAPLAMSYQHRIAFRVIAEATGRSGIVLWWTGATLLLRSSHRRSLPAPDICIGDTQWVQCSGGTPGSILPGEGRL